jgi:hypothetical protein
VRECIRVLAPGGVLNIKDSRHSWPVDVWPAMTILERGRTNGIQTDARTSRR